MILSHFRSYSWSIETCILISGFNLIEKIEKYAKRGAKIIPRGGGIFFPPSILILCPCWKSYLLELWFSNLDPPPLPVASIPTLTSLTMSLMAPTTSLETMIWPWLMQPGLFTTSSAQPTSTPSIRRLTEVAIYKRKQEIRKQDNNNSTKKAIKKTRKKERKHSLDQEKKEKTFFFS